MVSNYGNFFYDWVVTGSLGMALQGVPVEIHDIDIQTDKDGAYEIEDCFFQDVIKPVRYTMSERIQSHFGMLEIDGIRVEIMGDMQKKTEGPDLGRASKCGEIQMLVGQVWNAGSGCSRRRFAVMGV